jgi:hypothetical protein
VLSSLFLVVVAPSAPAATFFRINGDEIKGGLQSVDGKARMVIEGEKGAVTVPADELMRVEFVPDREPDPTLDGVVLYLPRGDRIGGKLVASSRTHLTVRSVALGDVKLPLTNLTAIEFRRAGEQPRDVARLREQLLANQTRNDVVFAATGDQMPGILSHLATDEIKLKSSLGEMPLKTTRLFGIAFAARSRKASPPQLLAVARCTDDSVVTGTLRAGERRLALSLLAGPDVEIDTDSVIDVVFRHGKLVYLSDLKPATVTVRSYFGGDLTWPHQTDRNYDRKPLKLGGKTYRKGLGTFAGMTLAYDLGGEFSTFAAKVGIDDADVNAQGNVNVRVLGDGKILFEKKRLTRADGPADLKVSVKGVKTLTLVVEFGENHHFGDLTDWANAHLIR